MSNQNVVRIAEFSVSKNAQVGEIERVVKDTDRVGLSLITVNGQDIPVWEIEDDLELDLDPVFTHVRFVS